MAEMFTTAKNYVSEKFDNVRKPFVIMASEKNKTISLYIEYDFNYLQRIMQRKTREKFPQMLTVRASG